MKAELENTDTSKLFILDAIKAEKELIEQRGEIMTKIGFGEDATNYMQLLSKEFNLNYGYRGGYLFNDKPSLRGGHWKVNRFGFIRGFESLKDIYEFCKEWADVDNKGYCSASRFAYQ